MPNRRVTWSQVDEGFYIGSRAGQFIGYIDQRDDGAFTAFDLSSEVVGNFAALSGAMAALTEAIRSSTPGGLDDD